MRRVLYSVVYAQPARASILKQILPGPVVCVKSQLELLEMTTGGVGADLAFVDLDLIGNFDGDSIDIPIVGIMDCKPADVLANTIRLFESHPWLSHVVAASMLGTPRARPYMATFFDRFAAGPKHSMLGTLGVGRVALLARASRREARFERMREFFSRHSLSDRSISTVIEVAEELAMNALYDAPSEAGYFETPRQRIEDVELPPNLACEIGYGIEDRTVLVRIRDPFGALSRTRLIQVLNRCNTHDVALDESRGGAGLGLWRVFSVASSVAITVVPGSLTEFLVSIRMTEGRLSAKQKLDAVHLFFASKSEAFVRSEYDHGLVDQSITLSGVA